MLHCKLYGPHHAKICLQEYADSEGADQPAHLQGLNRAFTVRLQNHWTSGPSCSKLTMSLVNDLLKFTLSDMQIC